MWHHHGSDTPTSPRAILHHTDAILYTFLQTTVPLVTNKDTGKLSRKGLLQVQIFIRQLNCTLGEERAVTYK